MNCVAFCDVISAACANTGYIVGKYDVLVTAGRYILVKAFVKNFDFTLFTFKRKRMKF